MLLSMAYRSVVNRHHALFSRRMIHRGVKRKLEKGGAVKKKRRGGKTETATEVMSSTPKHKSADPMSLFHVLFPILMAAGFVAFNPEAQEKLKGVQKQNAPEQSTSPSEHKKPSEQTET